MTDAAKKLQMILGSAAFDALEAYLNDRVSGKSVWFVEWRSGQDQPWFPIGEWYTSAAQAEAHMLTYEHATSAHYRVTEYRRGIKHPVDAMKEISEAAGLQMSPEAEAEMRAICDAEVCLTCGEPPHEGRCAPRVISRTLTDGVRTKDGVA